MAFAAITEIEADLPQDTYKVTWFDTKSNTTKMSQPDNGHRGGVRLVPPPYLGYIALNINTLK
jgi:hypothetical protein